MRPGVALAVAAAVVNAPRLVLAFVEADGVVVPEAVRSGLLALTGVATGVLLTLGAAHLAHRAASVQRGRGLVLASWLVVLVATALLVPPFLVLAVRHSPLAAVLVEPWSQWMFAVLAAITPDLVAAGAMAAEVLGEPSALEARRTSPRAVAGRPGVSTASVGAIACRNACGASFGSCHAERAHQRACRLREAG